MGGEILAHRRQGDPGISGGQSHTEFTSWHDGAGRAGSRLDGAIPAAFYLSPINDPQERSYGDYHDTTPVPLTHAPMLDPKDERSKHKGYWAGTIGGRLDEG